MEAGHVTIGSFHKKPRKMQPRPRRDESGESLAGAGLRRTPAATTNGVLRHSPGLEAVSTSVSLPSIASEGDLERTRASLGAGVEASPNLDSGRFGPGLKIVSTSISPPTAVSGGDLERTRASLGARGGPKSFGSVGEAARSSTSVPSIASEEVAGGGHPAEPSWGKRKSSGL